MSDVPAARQQAAGDQPFVDEPLPDAAQRRGQVRVEQHEAGERLLVAAIECRHRRAILIGA